MKASPQPKPMYCSRDYYYSSRFNQQYEKPTPITVQHHLHINIPTKKGQTIHMMELHQKAITELKGCLQRPHILVYQDPSKPK